MGRPTPKVTLTIEDRERTWDVLIAPNCYAVCYRGKLITLRNDKEGRDIKYSKTTFPHAGHARRLAARLNDLFQTDDFTVLTMSVEPRPKRKDR